MIFTSISPVVDLDNGLEDEISATPLNQLIPLRTNFDTNEAPVSSVFDFADSPVDSPTKPIAGRTRKAQAKVKREQFIRKSNSDWGIGQSKLEKCTSCKKTQSERSRQRVSFQRAVKSGVKCYVGDSETASAASSEMDKGEENSDRENQQPKSIDKHDTKSGKSLPAKVKKGGKKTVTKSAPENNQKRKRDTKPVATASGPQGSTTDISADSISSGYVSVSPAKSPGSSKRASLSPTVRLVKTASPTIAANAKQTTKRIKNLTPTSTPKASKGKKEAQYVAYSSPQNISPRLSLRSTPTSTPRMVKRTESPGKSPALIKKNPKGETPLHVAVIKVSH